MSLKLPRNWDFNLKMDAARIARSKSVMPGEAARAAAPCAPERPLKSGWLRKQRSIVRNWQQRFFVLKGQRLLYYKDEDEAKPQVAGAPRGVRGASAASLGASQGASAEQNWAGQDSCVLMASSQADMEEWVKSIRRALGSASAGTGRRERRGGGGCSDHVAICPSAGDNRPGAAPGPARGASALLPGERLRVRRSDTDVHTVASLLKLYLRELPEPVVPWGQYEDFLLCGQALDADERKGHEELLKQLSLLPRDNYNLLSYICRFLHEIQLNSSINKMSVDNLATVIGVNLIRPKIEDPAVIMRGTPQIQKVMTVMISDHADLFPPCKDAPLSPRAEKHPDGKKAPVPRSSVGWDAAEDPAGPRPDGSMRRATGDDLNAGSAANPSVPGEDNDVKPSKDTLGTWKTQSRKRTQTLPNRKSFLTAASQEEKGRNGKSDVFAGEFWKSSPGSGVPSALADGHKRTLSHDLFKLLDQHRAPRHNEAPALPAASGGSEQQFPASPSPGRTAGGSPAGAPAEPGDSGRESTELLHRAILNLEKQMEAQKKSYEEEIKSLEKENYEVWAKVVRLNQEVEREKKKSEDLEQKLRDTELLREDMERKNKMLEEEIKNLTQ
ncbi:RHG25 protein, partial [Nothocercus nigrocapillus]|nr:RHG25 protein [Nothocercus nigrocapillus]